MTAACFMPIDYRKSSLSTILCQLITENLVYPQFCATIEDTLFKRVSPIR